MAEERMLNDEILLGLIKANSGGGGGGTTDYEDLDNKPQIGGVTLSGNKSLSDLGAQEKLTAGMYININSGTISVKRDVSEDVDEVLTLTHDTSGGTNKINAVLTVGGETIDSETITTSGGTFHDLVQISFNGQAVRFKFKYLVASKTQSAGYENYIYNEYTDTFVETIGEESKLIIKSELDTALSGKQDTLTFDDAPTDNSNNPVKSNGIYDALTLKQDATDNSLETTDKTIVGAINEHEGDIGTLKSGLTNLDNEVNGDATVYPYADVITIDDAVPANLADCSVKIEPDQDLHGYNHPWVGGAGKNLLDESVVGLYQATAEQVERYGYAPFVLKAGTYTISYVATNPLTPLYITYTTDWSYTELSPAGTAITLTQDTEVFIRSGLDYTSSEAAFRSMFSNTQVELGSTATSYEPYSNICPITGHTEASVQRDGVNQWDEEWELGGIDDTTGEKTPASTQIRSKNYIPCQAETSYYVASPSLGISVYVYFYGSNQNFIGRAFVDDKYSVIRKTITTPENCAYMMLKAGTLTTYNNDISINYPSTNTDYVPYAGKTYTIALGDTIYGGNVDFDSGVMTVTHALADMGDMSWTYNNGYYQTTSVSNLIKKPSSNKELVSAICEAYSVNNWNDINNTDNGQFAGSIGGNLVFVNTAYTTASDFKTAMDGVQLCYELATPTTIQLTPQQIQLLKGQNTLTASTGQISVTVNGASGSIGAVQEQANATDEALAELVADIAEKLPTAPTTDGAYVLTVTVADGTPTYSWVSAT